jgi:RNA polymerase sigma-70 factor (ECF subfamily)
MKDMEREQLRKARSGDLDAFGELIRLHQARLRAFVARYVESSHDVYDIVQDAWLDALRNLDSFDGERELLPWLRGICRNRVLNYYRSRRVRRTTGQSLVDGAIEAVAAADDCNDDELERVEALRRCIGQLPATQREVLDRRYLQGAAVKQMAADLNRTAASISMQLRRIRMTLLECVEGRLRMAEK